MKGEYLNQQISAKIIRCSISFEEMVIDPVDGFSQNEVLRMLNSGEAVIVGGQVWKVDSANAPGPIVLAAVSRERTNHEGSWHLAVLDIASTENLLADLRDAIALRNLVQTLIEAAGLPEA